MLVVNLNLFLIQDIVVKHHRFYHRSQRIESDVQRVDIVLLLRDFLNVVYTLVQSVEDLLVFVVDPSC